MKGLILDTSTKEGFAALSDSGQIIHFSSKNFLPPTAQLIENQELDFIAVGTGPGSYTGTRAGVAFAKTFAFARQLPLLGFLSPLAYTPQTAGPFTLILPAKGGEACFITGKKSSSALISHSKPQLKPCSEIPDLPPLNFEHLLPFLLDRLETRTYDPTGEVNVSYLYPIAGR